MSEAYSTTQAIRRYYEQNTRLFLSFGSAAGTYAIHRAVWANGVQTLDRALNYSSELILAEAQSLIRQQSLDPVRVIDLGCGVGSTLFYLSQHLDVPMQAVGLTISPLQAHLAHERASRLQLPHPCLFAEADFLAVPTANNMDVAISVEAYVHAVDPDCFLAEAARILKPGGRLILCDDFLSARAMSPFLNDAGRRWVLAYQQGWHIPNLCGEGCVQDLARSHGLTLMSDRDLTPHLPLRTLPDRLAKAIVAAGHRLPVRHAIVPSMMGSLALQHCLKLGLVQYRFLVFEKKLA